MLYKFGNIKLKRDDDNDNRNHKKKCGRKRIIK